MYKLASHALAGLAASSLPSLLLAPDSFFLILASLPPHAIPSVTVDISTEGAG